MSGEDGFGGREISLDDPLGEGDEGWNSLELDRSGRGSGSADDPQALMYGESAGRVIGDAFDGLGGPEVELELDLGAMRPPSDPSASAVMSGPPPAAVARSVPPRAAARVSLPASPLPRSSLSPAIEPTISPRAITLGDFGEPPRGIVGTVPYALHAVLRLRALKADLARLVRLRDGAAKDLDEGLIELGRALHARREDPGLEVLAGLMRVANEAGAVAGEHTAEWQRVRAAATSQKGALADRIEAIEERARPAREREKELAVELSERERARDRIGARRSRLKIELRNLSDPAHAERRASLEAELEVREAELERAAAHAEALGPDLDAARRDLATFTREIAAIEQEQRAVDKTRGRSEKALSSSAKVAEEQYHAAVKAVAQQAVVRGVAEAVAPQLAKLARNRSQALATREEEVALHEVAVTLVDRASLQRGLAIMGVVALILVAMIVFAVVR